MSAGLSVRPILTCGLIAVASIVGAHAQDPSTAAREKEKEQEKQKQQRLDQQFEESLGWYQLSAGPDSSSTMKIQRVLRWTNPTRGQKGEPTLIFWINAGRPEALASVYPWSGNLVYECVSLSRDPGLTAREGGRTVWSPGSPGVTFRDLDDAPTPAETPAARLQQAKSLSERFKAALTPTNADGTGREELRLLPRPIYRYEIGEAKAAHPELIDGAAFAFVQGTDPEAILLIEAVRRGDKKSWQYAFGRATSVPVEARLGSSVVWTAPGADWSNPRMPILVLGRPLVE
jgi:hypothetical protein